MALGCWVVPFVGLTDERTQDVPRNHAPSDWNWWCSLGAVTEPLRDDSVPSSGRLFVKIRPI